MLRGVTTPVGIFPVGFRWGAVSGTTAGELLHVGYSGATVVAARLTLADGRELEFDVVAGELTLLLPDDTPDGFATVLAELGDGATQTLVILLHGLAVSTGPPIPRVGPARRREPARRTITSASRVRLAAGTRVIAAPAPRRTRITAAAGTRRLELFRPLPETRLAPSRIVVAGGARLVAGHIRPARLTLTSTTAVGRRDGPGLEEALLLDLL